MASATCATHLVRPKAIRPAISTSRSCLFPVPQRPSGARSASPRLPVLKKSHSTEAESNCGPDGLPQPLSLSKLAGMEGARSASLNLGELLHIEAELARSPLSGLSNDSEEARNCAEAPARPENPQVRDRLWLSGADTDSDY